MPSFEAIKQRFRQEFSDTEIKEVNRRAGGPPVIIEWGQRRGWILVGGQAMDRGFTVEGLTVTYMPRGPGMGNADTVQQRGRFFGYKRRYLGFCRVYLEQDALVAFQDYVEHEEYMRRELQKIQRSGQPLSAWKRAFVLSPDLQPCRRNVIEHDYVRGNYSNRWYYPAVALAPGEIAEANREIIHTFLKATPLASIPDSEERELAQRHRVARGLSLVQVVERLIVPFRVTGAADTRELIGVMVQLSEALATNQGELCTVHEISPEYARQRAVDNNGRINELFQGATRLASGGYGYPGDSAFRDDDVVSVQIHRLDLKQGGNVVAERVPVIAIWIPSRLAIDWAAQHQPA